MATTAFVSTYPPQRCGIATFTSDLAAAVGDREVVALQPPDKPGFYPLEVSRRVARDVLPDYLSAARWIDDRPFRVVSLQHEYGIWGGQDGAYVLDFVKALRTPVVATLHTVLQNPTPSQRRILTELVHVAAQTVVMSTAAASLMTRSYGIDPHRLEIVPHGVPKLPLAAPDSVKPQLGLAGHKVILSFGLLGRGKGYESAIAAMPAVVRADPTALYVIVGATHPDLLRREGEAYRNQLAQLAASLGVAHRVRFVGRYVAAGELALWLTAADIFVTPYPNLEQIVSGTLSYAMGAGKAIVSTTPRKRSIASASSFPELPPKFTPANGTIRPSARAAAGASTPSSSVRATVRLNDMRPPLTAGCHRAVLILTSVRRECDAQGAIGRVTR